MASMTMQSELRGEAPSVAAIVATCDRQILCHRALQSVLHQTVAVKEIIIVDNGREAFLTDVVDSRLRVIRTEPRIGASRARNIGASLADSDLLAFLDDDDFWLQDYVARMTSHWDYDVKPDLVVGGKYRVVSGRPTLRKAVYSTDGLRERLLVSNPGIGGQNIIVSRGFFQSIGGFDESLRTSEDRSFALSMIANGGVLRFAPGAAVITTTDAGSRLTDDANLIRGRLAFMIKHRREIGLKAVGINSLKIVKNIVGLAEEKFRKMCAIGGRFIPQRLVNSFRSGFCGSQGASEATRGILTQGRFTKAGRLNFIVKGRRCGDPSGRLIEAFSMGHAEFLLRLNDQNLPLPGMHETSGSLIVQDWIDGHLAHPSDVALFADLLAKFHRFPIHSIGCPPEDCFDYWFDYIRPRAMRAAAAVGHAESVARLVTDLDDWWRSGTALLSHPDLSPRNTVLTTDADRVVVDNELLSVGMRPELDVCNAGLPLGGVADEFLTQYAFQMRGKWSSIIDEEMLNAVWALRRAGSSYQATRLAEALSWIDLARVGGWSLPFSEEAWFWAKRHLAQS